MSKYIVFGAFGEYIVNAETPIRAIQEAIMQVGGTSIHWNAHLLSSYSEKHQKMLTANATILG